MTQTCNPTIKDRKHSIRFVQPSLTQQHQKDETDINKIMKRFVKTGIIDHVNKHQPHYGENTAIDYQQSLDIIIQAENMFAELPSQARKHFDNDPKAFLKFVEDPNNHDKLYDLGLSNTPPSVPDAPSKPAEQEATTTTATAE